MTTEIFKRKKLPDTPGVYFFKHGKEILYIGKATSLRDRVKSYFSKDLIDTRGPLLVDMVFHADKIDYEKTDSVLEAIILEANLIKKYQPKYNTKEKSDKSFNYVCITKPARPHDSSGAGGEDLPKVVIKRGKELESVQSSTLHRFGPYTSGVQLKEALKIIRPIFPFLDDKSKNYYKFYKQVELVPEVSSIEGIKQYKNNIKNLKLFFQGKKKEVLRNLEKEMKKYAEMHMFEKAGEVKKQIFSLKHINDVALLKEDVKILSSSSLFRLEAYDVAHMSGKNMVGVMTVVEDGEIAKNEYKKFKIRTQTDANDTGALTEILERRLAHMEWTYPHLIVVDGGVAQLNTGKKILKKLNLNIPIVSVLKDDRHKPKGVLGDKKYSLKYEKEILLANSEAHRFSINYHKNMRNKNFLK